MKWIKASERLPDKSKLGVVIYRYDFDYLETNGKTRRTGSVVTDDRHVPVKWSFENKTHSNVEWLDETPSAEQGEWVELKEGNPLPDYDEYVLWYDEAGNTHVDCLDKDGNPWMPNEADEFEGWKMPKATHWRKLPKPPIQ